MSSLKDRAVVFRPHFVPILVMRLSAVHAKFIHGIRINAARVAFHYVAVVAAVLACALFRVEKGCLNDFLPPTLVPVHRSMMTFTSLSIS
jgi:hypothetical protein